MAPGQFVSAWACVLAIPSCLLKPLGLSCGPHGSWAQIRALLGSAGHLGQPPAFPQHSRQPEKGAPAPCLNPQRRAPGGWQVGARAAGRALRGQAYQGGEGGKRAGWRLQALPVICVLLFPPVSGSGQALRKVQGGQTSELPGAAFPSHPWETHRPDGVRGATQAEGQERDPRKAEGKAGPFVLSALPLC